jgi:cytidylate kinase
MDKLNIDVKKEKNRADSFWYCDQPIATYGRYHLISAGEIRIVFADEPDRCYRDFEAIEMAREKGLIDKDLNDESKILDEKGQIVMECDIGVVAHDYDEAIDLLKYYYAEKHKNGEEQTIY